MIEVEKLKQLRARYVELLAIAEKRTPGKWRSGVEHGRFHVILTEDAFSESDWLFCGDEDLASEQDAEFIASCAGAAEAGWRSAIAAIDLLLYAAGFAPHAQSTFMPLQESILDEGKELLK